MSNLNLDQILGGMVLGWFTLGIFTMIMRRYLKGDGGWIEPPQNWPRPIEGPVRKGGTKPEPSTSKPNIKPAGQSKRV